MLAGIFGYLHSPIETSSASAKATAWTSALPPQLRRNRGDTRQDRPLLSVGKTTIDRAEAVVVAAEEQPEEYGRLVEQMDRSGKVAGA